MSTAPWANEPFELQRRRKLFLALFKCNSDIQSADVEQDSHSAFSAAIGMSYAHNCLLRGLNAIMLQAPHIPSYGSPGHNPSDVRDLLTYICTWVKTVDHHHHVEETVMFPEIEAMAGDEGEGLFSGALHQHREFHDGLDELLRVAESMQADPSKYSWTTIKAIIDHFAPALVDHLRDEINLLLSLERFDSTALSTCWKKAEDVAKANGKISFLYEIFSLVLGCCDKTYQGGNDFPPLPRLMPYAITYWFGRTHAGAWRFNPCDFWGRPRLLPMLPENRS